MNASDPLLTGPLLESSGLDVGIGGHSICRRLDWRVEAGQSWAILGRNGAGKSTLLATLAGLHAQQAGRLEVAGLALPGATRGAGARAMAPAIRAPSIRATKRACMESSPKMSQHYSTAGVRAVAGPAMRACRPRPLRGQAQTSFRISCRWCNVPPSCTERCSI